MKRSKKGATLKADREAAIATYREEMEKLWLPSVEIIRYSCSREVMGFVTQRSFSNARGCCQGVEYVTSQTLDTLFSLKFTTVLIRNTDTLKYLKGTIEIDLPIN